MASSPTEHTWQPFTGCPRCCAIGEDGMGTSCGQVGAKLTKTSGFNCVSGCSGPSCRSRRNQKKGKRGEYNAHRKMGGTGFTPHDEMGRAYSIEVIQQVKKGRQIPRQFVSFVHSEWARHAWSQAERVTPAGVQAFPAIYMEPEGGGSYLVVRL